MKRIVIVLALSLTLAGCAPRQKAITNIPAGVTQAQVQSWDSAVANLNKIAVANSGARKLLIQLHNTNDANGNAIFPSGPVYATSITVVGKIDQVENAAASFLQTVPNDWSASTKTKVADYMSQISNLVQQLNSESVIGIKDSNSQNQVNTFISEISSAISLTLSL